MQFASKLSMAIGQGFGAMRDFGIEIEFLMPNLSRETVAAAVNAAGVPCYAALRSRTELTQWKVVGDGSVQPMGSAFGYGMELVSPPYPCADAAGTEAAFEQVRKVCGAISLLGAFVNRTCGLHVHIGARGLDIKVLKKLAALYIEHEPVIDEFMPPSRRGSANNYCRGLGATNINALKNATDVGGITHAIEGASRYVKLNFNSYWKHGTVEFRHHGGTIDATKIINWVIMCSKMMETAIEEQDDPITLEGGTTNRTVVTEVAEQFHFAERFLRGRQLRELQRALLRGNGITDEEMRLFLGRSTLPNLRRQMERLGVPFHVEGSRGGFPVYYLDHTPRTRQVKRVETVIQPVISPNPPTLEGLWAKLKMTDPEKAFWAERLAFLNNRTGANVPAPVTGEAE